MVFSTLSAAAQLRLSAGSVVRIDPFPSKHIFPRTVDIWLPDGHSPARRYAVLYMHDGQMLFDSTATWNRQEWAVDETLTRLRRKKQIPDVIVVGIWNVQQYRAAEYFPEKALSYLGPAARADAMKRVNDTPRADAYLRFLTTELKPFIDSQYATRADRAHTFIAGSSMGGLISIYALCEYPDVFGGAACLSTHWPGSFTFGNNDIPTAFVRYLADHLPDPKTHRIYFDHGTRTLDSFYAPHQLRVDSLMRRSGWDRTNWMTRIFPGTEHSEWDWAARFHIPALFLMEEKKKNRGKNPVR